MASGLGTATADFGGAPTEIATVVVTGQTGIGATDHVECYFQGDDFTVDNPAEVHKWILPRSVRAVADAIVAGTGFTITLLADFPLTGTVKVRFVWAS
jgi:hypothetical protein